MDSVGLATGFCGPRFAGSGIWATGFTATAPNPPPVGLPRRMLLPGPTTVYQISAPASDMCITSEPMTHPESCSGCSRMSTCAAMAHLFAPFGAHVLGLSDHIYLEPVLTQHGDDLSQGLPGGLLIGAHVHALCRAEPFVDGSREVVDIGFGF